MRILLADEHHLFQVSLAAYLARVDPSLEIQTAVNKADFESMLKTQNFQALIATDILMTVDGIDSALSKIPNIIILKPIEGANITSVMPNPQGISLPKSVPAKMILSCLHRLREGGDIDYQSMISHQESQNAVRIKPKNPLPSTLTLRERQVLSFLAKGATNKEISRALDLQVVTIKLHVRSLCRKIGARNRTQIALLAVENDWIGNDV